MRDDDTRVAPDSAETLDAGVPAEPVSSHRLVGSLIGGKYAVEGLIHLGRRNDLFAATHGYGDVAEHVVLKVAHELSLESASLLAREAGFLGALDSPNVMKCHDVATDEQSAYLVLEPFAGQTLAEVLERSGTLQEPEVLEIFWQILAATREMHAAGVIHRDLRPRNVLLRRRVGHAPLINLIDFASARFLRPDHPDAELEPPYPFGAHRYMAPEQHLGLPTGPWVDIYAIGMMLHAALTGELAEPGARLRDRREVAQKLDDVVARALEEQPGARFPTALDFQDALTRALLIG